MTLTPGELARAYERFGHLVLARCLVILRHRQDAEDALQEVFVRLFRYGDAFLEAESPVRWLYRVAERVCFDALRRRRTREVLLAPTDLPLDPPHDPTRAIVDRDVLLELFSRLDDDLKSIALLHFVDGLSQEAIGVELGWSRQTVNKKLHKLKDRAAALKRPLGGA